MKKTLTINLNNTVYHIDNDAYELLQQYLNEVEERLSPDEKQEVMADIESRISELFSEKLQKGKNVINIQDVEEVINILGKPNQFSEEEETEKETKQSARTEGGRFKRKFYRDPDNGVLGGVAAGLAVFIGWDVVLVRVLMILILLFGWGTIIPIYLVLWLIVPAAKTISQKLEMQGEDVTAERIKSEINNLKNYVESDKFKESATGIGNKLGEVIRAVFKVLLGFIGAIMGFVGFILLGVLLLLLSFLIFDPSIFTGIVPELNIFSPDRAVLMVISLLLIIGIPIFMLIYWAIRIITGRGRSSGAFSWVMVILWFVGIFMFAGLSAKTIVNLGNADFDKFEIYWSNDEEDFVDEMRTVAAFNGLEISGNIEVELTQDSVQSVRVSSRPSLLPYLITEVDDRGILKLYTRKLHVNSPAKVRIAAGNIAEVVASGACKVNSFGKITAENMKVELSGVSQANLDVRVAQDLKVYLSGVSKAEIDGHAYKLYADVSGASQLEADDLLVKNAKVFGVSASQIEANVSDSLIVDVSGASHFKAGRKPFYVKQYKSGGSSISIN